MRRVGESAKKLTALLCGTALMLAAATAASAQEVIKIAAGAPLTGPLAKQGQEVANAVKLAVAEWNKKGGVLGKRVEVVDADDQGSPQVGVAAGEKVAADPAVMGAVWGITSVTCIPVSEIFEKVDLAMISPGCSNPKVTDRGLKSVARLCARDATPLGVPFLDGTRFDPDKLLRDAQAAHPTEGEHHGLRQDP
jgi:branched-chain amino acid transport system substrate-binding protein